MTTSTGIQLDRLTALLDRCKYGQTIHYVEEVESTQNLAASLVREGAPDGLLVLAEQQTSGRGRFGRPWFSPPGSGIYMSLVLSPRIPHKYMAHLTIVTSVALCRVLRRLTGIDIRLKWPNDLYAADRKLSGILIESCSEDHRRLIMGVGITVNVAMEQFPEWLRDKATSLFAQSGQIWEREVIIANFLHELDSLIDLYESAGFAVFRAIWEAHAWQPSHPAKMMTPQGPIVGMPVSIDEHGALVVQLEDGKVTTIYSGEISDAIC